MKKTTSILRFSQAWYEAQGAYQRILPILRQLKVIERVPKQLTQAQTIIQNAQEIKAQRYQHLWVKVNKLTLHNSPTIDPNTEVQQQLNSALHAQLSQAIEKVGLKVWPESQCPTSKIEEVLVFNPIGQMKCSVGFLGPQCGLSLRAQLTLCPHSQLGEVNWSNLKIFGVHPQEEQHAIRRLLKNLGNLDLTKHFAKAISPFIVL